MKAGHTELAGKGSRQFETLRLLRIQQTGLSTNETRQPVEKKYLGEHQRLLWNRTQCGNTWGVSRWRSYWESSTQKIRHVSSRGSTRGRSIHLPTNIQVQEVISPSDRCTISFIIATTTINFQSQLFTITYLSAAFCSLAAKRPVKKVAAGLW